MGFGFRVQSVRFGCDFSGLGRADLTPKLSNALLDISGKHFPEHLGIVGVLKMINTAFWIIEDSGQGFKVL